MVFSLSILVVPVILIAIIALIVTGIRLDKDKGGDEVIRNVYLYLVLFATLMMTIGGSVGTFMAVADIVAPVPYYQSFEDFKRWEVDKHNIDKEVTEEVKASETELRERYDAMVSAEKEKQIDRAKNSLIKSLGWIVIPLPVFIYFQRRLAKKEE